MSADDFLRLVVSALAIWGARRKAIYEDIFQSPLATNSFISVYLDEVRQVNTRTQRPASAHLVRRSLWIPPNQGRAKINVDAAVSPRRKCGAVGAICRDRNGDFLGASVVVHKFITDPPTLEAMSVREWL